MVGKSAHGNSGKVPYYEHGWATKLMGAEIRGAMNCSPFRILAKKLEPLVWEKIENLLTDPTTAQIDVLAERLAGLPASVSPGPIYKQLERLEAAKTAEESVLKSVNEGTGERPAELSSYKAFIDGLRKIRSNARREKGLPSHNLSQSASHAEPGWRERGLGMDMDVRASGKDCGKEGPLLVYGSNRLTNGGRYRD